MWPVLNRPGVQCRHLPLASQCLTVLGHRGHSAFRGLTRQCWRVSRSSASTAPVEQTWPLLLDEETRLCLNLWGMPHMGVSFVPQGPQPSPESVLVLSSSSNSFFEIGCPSIRMGKFLLCLPLLFHPFLAAVRGPGPPEL